MRYEVDHHPLQRRLVRLAVGHRQARLRYETAHPVRDGGDRLDPVVNQVHLPAARQLGPDGTCDHVAIEPHDVRLDRQPVLRRRLDNRQVTDAGE